MDLRRELGTDLHEALKRHARERANLKRSLQNLQKILAGIAVGIFAFVDVFGDFGPDHSYSFSRVISDTQIVCFTSIALLAFYFLTKRRYTRKVYGELDRIKERLGDQASETWKIGHAADELYKDMCDKQNLPKEGL